MTETPNLFVRDVVVDEKAGKARFVVWLDDAGTDAVQVDFATASGTAIAGRDFVGRSGTLTFESGQTSKVVEVTLRDDSTAEGRERFSLELSNAVGATLVDAAGAGIIGANDGNAVTLPALRAGDVSVSERDGEAVVVVSLSAPSTRTVSVAYATAYDSATASDAVAASGRLSFAPGQTTQTVHLTLRDDAGSEARESLRLVLGDASRASLADASARITIVDDDGSAYVQSAGLSDDTYLIGAGNDVIVENPGGGYDIARSTVNYRLGANVEELVLLGSAAAGTGNALANRIVGTAAANRLDGGGGGDTLAGGDGNDTYVVDASADRVVETNAARTQIDSVLASATFTLGANVERLTLTGTRAVDGSGNALANTIIGNAAANRLAGGSGNDTVSGGKGNDLLDGGPGRDALTGGTGHDTFRFTTRPSTANADRIIDFDSADDRLLFDNADFTRIGPAGKLAAKAFVLGTRALDAADRIVYDRPSGQLFYDPDGSGSAAKVIVATFGAGTAVTLDDLWIS